VEYTNFGVAFGLEEYFLVAYIVEVEDREKKKRERKNMVEDREKKKRERKSMVVVACWDMPYVPGSRIRSAHNYVWVGVGVCAVGWCVKVCGVDSCVKVCCVHSCVKVCCVHSCVKVCCVDSCVKVCVD
jgi:hypothetical protein